MKYLTILADTSQKHVIRVDSLPQPDTTSGQSIETILGIVFAVTGSIAVLIIVIAGFRYALSQGDSNAMAQAKNTIIYAVVGLVISIAAFSIVTFVVKGVS